MSRAILLTTPQPSSVPSTSEQHKTLLTVLQETKPDISVVTVTNKPGNLLHIAKQIAGQEFTGQLEHIIVMDGKDVSSEIIATLTEIYNESKIQLKLIKAAPQPDRYLFEKLGALRNFGADTASGEMLAFWDDDNRWVKNHLQSLYDPLTKDSEIKAGHSWRGLYNRDDHCSPHIVEKDKYPWITDNPRNSKKMYDIQVAAGILTPNSHETHDVYGYDGGTACCVDTGEWLFRKTMFNLENTRFNESFSLHWQMFGYTDDQVLGLRMLQAGIKPAEVYRSEQATLLYTLGGCSQNHTLASSESDLKLSGSLTSPTDTSSSITSREKKDQRSPLNFSSFSEKFRTNIEEKAILLLQINILESKDISISVVTVSNKPENLVQLAKQIAEQKFSGKLEHIIVIDGKDVNQKILAELKEIYIKANIQLKLIKAGLQPNRYLFEKLGALRNYGVSKTSGKMLAFWDDDNRWRADHLQSLYAPLTQDKKIKAAHSWRLLYNRDGSDYKVENNKYPWITDNLRNSERMYRIQVKAGILQPDSQETHDIYGYENGTACCVDTGEWLFRREMFDNPQTKFAESLPLHKQMFGYTDDQILGLRMLKNGIAPKDVFCTKQPTLLYSLGGCSQVHTEKPVTDYPIIAALARGFLPAPTSSTPAIGLVSSTSTEEVLLSISYL